jgi:hypothetical protein
MGHLTFFDLCNLLISKNCITSVTSVELGTKDWAGKKVTILYSKFFIVKSSGIIQFFYLHFTWLCGSWNDQKLLKKLPFWRNDSWFSSEVSKSTSVKYPWNDAFSGMTKIDFDPYCPIIVIVLTKCSLYWI